MKQKTTKCQYPDWEGGIVLGKHVFGKDGFCAVCGELQNVGHPIIDDEKVGWERAAEQVVSEILNEDGYIDTLHLGC